MLRRNGGETSGGPLQRALADPDPLVRDGAVTAAEGLPPEERLPLLSGLLRDPIRTVRIDAARALAGVPKEAMNSSERADFEKALAEFVQSQLVDADRAEAHLNLAGVYANFANVSHSDYEFTITFARVDHEVEEEEVPGVVVSRVNLSPRFMQELIEAMEDNYSKWRTREGIKNLPEFDSESDDDYGAEEEGGEE
jgi:hypothetical protein